MKEVANAAPALWLVIATGAAVGLLSSIIGYALLGVPLVRVKTFHDLHVDEKGPRVDSYVVVTNTRGRPVKIDEVFFLKGWANGGPRVTRPVGWTMVGRPITEGETIKYTFKREEFPNAVAVAIDSAGRIWPRRRWIRVQIRRWYAAGVAGWPWQRNGPTDRQIARAVRRGEVMRRADEESRAARGT
jgi:hypothetical protein